ncbi:uncharacterized protein [Miscanthus floridulus]|uniref:uncharacterized protein n=1 Tax=Miscanthus floridulus TaxID=154761 RepID=UPI00345993FB
MTPDELIEGVRMSAIALSDKEILCRVRETVEGQLRSGGLTPFAMRPSQGYLSLGMRDVRASSSPVPEDIERRAVNRAHAEGQKKQKDTKEARRKRKNLERDELEKHRRQQRHDCLPVEPSPSPSLSDSLSDDDESEARRGTLDHLPDVRGIVLGASASSLAFLGGGGEDALGPAIACPGAQADMPEARALGKRAVSPVGSTTEVEQAAAGATQPPPPGVEGAPEPDEGQPAPADTGAVPPSPPLPVQRTRDAPEASGGSARLGARKALKVSTSSTAQWVVEAQAAIQHSVASARADPKEPVAQGEAAEAATRQAGEEAPMPCKAEAHELDEAEAPSVTKATEGEAEAPRTSKAEAMEADASRTTEAEVAEAKALGTTKAEAVDVGHALILPLVEDQPPSQESTRELEVHSISSDDTSRGQEVADAEAASTMEQPAPTSGEGSSVLVWDQLWRQKDLLTNANEHLSARNTEVEDLRLRCANMKAEAATAREQAAPLAARIKELEEELTQVVGDRDTFRSRAKQVEASAKAVVGQLGAE